MPRGRFVFRWICQGKFFPRLADLPSRTLLVQQFHLRPRRAGTGILLALLVLLLLAPTSAAERESELTFSGPPHITGTLHVHGAGEIQLFPGEGLALYGEAQRITVEEYVAVTHDLSGGRIGDGDADRQDHHFSGTFTLTTANDGFRGLMMSIGRATLESSPKNVTDLPLVPYHDPGLLLDEIGPRPQHRPGDGRIWTYQAYGERFPLPTTHATSQGAPALYLWDATFQINENGQTTTFTGGSESVQVAPGYERIEHTYHLIHFENAELELYGAPGTHTAWFHDPTLTLSGTLIGNSTHGTLHHSGNTHRLDNVPLTVGGDMVLHLQPTGALEPAQYTNPHIGIPYPTGGSYTASNAMISGSLEQVAFAGMDVHIPMELPLVTTLWILLLLGALLALTPQGKWALIGIIAPLYAKTQTDRLLESPHRERIWQAIEENPGINLSKLRNLMELGWGTTVYHVRLMEDRKLVTSVVQNGKRHFFINANGTHNADLREAVASITGRTTTQKIVSSILADPGRSQREIAQQLGLSDRVVTHHMGKLRKQRLIETRREGGRLRCHPTPLLAEAMAAVDNGLPQRPPVTATDDPDEHAAPAP